MRRVQCAVRVFCAHCLRAKGMLVVTFSQFYTCYRALREDEAEQCHRYVHALKGGPVLWMALARAGLQWEIAEFE